MSIQDERTERVLPTLDEDEQIDLAWTLAARRDEARGDSGGSEDFPRAELRNLSRSLGVYASDCDQLSAQR